MEFKIIVIISAIVIFSILNIIVKLIGYSFNARKYGVKTKAIIIGYYTYYDLKSIIWYPVVKFQDMNGYDIIALSNCLLAFPIYKVGDEINIEYYSDDFNKHINKEIFINRFGTKKEEITINSKVRYNILDIRHLLDSIIEVVFIIIFLIIIF